MYSVLSGGVSEVVILSLFDLLFVENTWHLGHPVVPLAAEELAFGGEVRGVIQCAVKDVNEIPGVGPVLQQTTPTFITKLPMQEGASPVVGLVHLDGVLA